MQVEKEYRVKDVADMLGVCKQTVFRWIKEGLLVAYKHIDVDRGTPYYIRESELRRFIDKGEHYGE